MRLGVSEGRACPHYLKSTGDATKPIAIAKPVAFRSTVCLPRMADNMKKDSRYSFSFSFSVARAAMIFWAWKAGTSS